MHPTRDLIYKYKSWHITSGSSGSATAVVAALMITLLVNCERNVQTADGRSMYCSIAWLIISELSTQAVNTERACRMKITSHI